MRVLLAGIVGTGDAFVISLTDASGARVTSLPPGTYTLLVHDRSDIHDFHLSGPGDVDVATPVESHGDFTFTVTLVAGTYTYVCDPHDSTMKGTFKVGSASSPPATTTTAKTPSVVPAKKPKKHATKPKKKK